MWCGDTEGHMTHEAMGFKFLRMHTLHISCLKSLKLDVAMADHMAVAINGPARYTHIILYG